MIKKDSPQLGIILGFLAPLLGLIVYYFAVFYSKGVGFGEFLSYLKEYRTLLTGVSSISLVANALLFTVFINTRKDQTAKGVFVATLIYGIAVVIIKFV
ncbi:MAG: hypothetical protein H7Y03_05565 [Chitinophagaceae bacterium]|nr:hypothetical protein [Chitinophagaceae bacterium]